MPRKRKINRVRQLLPAPDTTQISKLADWLEVSAWAQTDKRASRAEATSSFSFSDDNETADEIMDKTWSELRGRAVALGDIYPFSISTDEQFLEFKGDDVNPAYLICLLASYIGLPKGEKMKIWNSLDLSHAFEELCTHIAGKYLTDKFDSPVELVHFGSPRSKGWLKRDRHLSVALNKIIRLIGEGENRYHEVRSSRKRGDGGDGGLDILAIRRFPDGRHGNMIFLGQCAMAQEKSEYDSKIIDLTNFTTNIVEFRFPYVMAFFVPHVLSFADQDHKFSWTQIKNNKNIPFDRLRIGFYAPEWATRGIKKIFRTSRKVIKKEYSLV